MAEESGISDAVISPGSRNAPLIIEAEYRKHWNKYVVPDERSAAFKALGMALRMQKPVMLICTSGTAVLNYYPAVAEAFYSRVPLVIVSADRPPYRIDKGEGQTIRQHGVLQNHTGFFATLNTDQASGEDVKKVKTALETAIRNRLPVHLNVPFEEPLYETVASCEKFNVNIPTKFAGEILDDNLLDQTERIWKNARRKMILVSQTVPGEMLEKQLERLSRFSDTVILTENLSNIESDRFIAHIDRLIFPMDEERFADYSPDLLLTIGNNIISKKIKYLLRRNKPSAGHWHIGESSVRPDTFDALTEHFSMDPGVFFSQLLFRIYDTTPESDYAEKWVKLKQKRKEHHDIFLRGIPFGDLALYNILSELLVEMHVHWGNSTVIRYAQLFDFHPGVKHYSNRGTSGIDGSFSTAVGFALKSPGEKVLHVTGDLSYLYDSNAMWGDFPKNLKVLAVNNGGGDIFRFIPGPLQVPEYERYFVAKPGVDLLSLAKAFGLQTIRLKTEDRRVAKEIIETFLANDSLQVMEVETSGVPNAAILKSYFASLE